MSTQGKRPKKSINGWILALIDLLLAAMIVGGWFLTRFISDYFVDDEPYAEAETIVFSTPEPTPAPTPGEPTFTPGPEVTPTPDTRTEWQIRFADRFTDEVVTTENSYTSPNVAITITHHEVGEDKDKITYHLADIYVSNVQCFRSGLAATPPKFRMSASLLKMMEDNNAIVAINGDFCGYSYGGITVRNGTAWSYRGSGVDMCVLYMDGRMATYSPGGFKLDKENLKDVFQVWSFGPGLLNEDGSPRKIPWSAVANEHISGSNPRTAIGYYEPGHYCFLVVDGRQKGYSKGMTLAEMSELFSQLGCLAAFNLDGGGSSMMAFRGELISQIYAKQPRNLSDCLYIADIDPVTFTGSAPENTADPETSLAPSETPAEEGSGQK